MDSSEPHALWHESDADSGDFVTMTGLYQMLDRQAQEATLVYATPRQPSQSKKVKVRLIRAANNPRRVE